MNLENVLRDRVYKQREFVLIHRGGYLHRGIFWLTRREERSYRSFP